MKFTIVSPAGMVIFITKSSLILGFCKHEVSTVTLAILIGIPAISGTNGRGINADTVFPHFKIILFELYSQLLSAKLTSGACQQFFLFQQYPKLDLLKVILYIN